MSGMAMLTPPASAASPTPSTASVIARSFSSLPTARRHPLAPGSAKEINLIHYLDDQLERVYRRWEKREIKGQQAAKKFSEHDDAPGYENMEQIIADLDPLVDVVWISHTPSLQVAYLLSIAGYINSYLPAFPFTPAVFPILTKIDQAFVSLLASSDNHTEPANGASKSPTKTDRVRIKSLVEETRVTAVNAASKSGWEADIDDSDEEEFETETSIPDDIQDFDDSAVNAGLGKIYKGTIEILGDSLI